VGSKPLAAALVAVLSSCVVERDVRPPEFSVCEVSRDFARYRNQLLAVRGVYHDGLRQQCVQKCGVDGWPSSIWVVDTDQRLDDPPVSFRTDQRSLDALNKAVLVARDAARGGRRVEVSATIIGVLRTRAHHSPLGPCDRVGSELYGFGHLGAFPAQLVVREVRNIRIEDNPSSPFNYSFLPERGSCTFSTWVEALKHANNQPALPNESAMP
jgi:hypothetical protein